jgi:hypothetical protein
MRMNIDNACPICGHALKDGEKLTAVYLPKHNWWVLHHKSASDSDICAQAGWQFDTDSNTWNTPKKHVA